MAKRKLFRYLAAAAGYVGIGLILGYGLSDQATNTPLWLGIVLTLLGAILVGMFISAGTDSAKPTAPTSSSGSPSAYPPNEDE